MYLLFSKFLKQKSIEKTQKKIKKMFKIFKY